jgi:hypothetical protein
MSENVPFIGQIHSKFTKRANTVISKVLFSSKFLGFLKNADFYVDSKFVEMGQKCPGKRYRPKSMRILSCLDFVLLNTVGTFPHKNISKTCYFFYNKHSHQTHSHPGIRVMNIIQDLHALVSGQ